MQEWSKHGLIMRTPERHEWITSHAQVPTPLKMNDRTVRFFFGARDARNRTHPLYVEVDAQHPERVVDFHDQPLLSLGVPGTFDDCGVMPSCAIQWRGAVYLYYIGWNTGVTVPYRNSIGVALSHDGGTTFGRVFDGPVLDRSKTDPYFVATPFVMEDEGRLRMWYLSATAWQQVEGRMEPSYTIRHAESDDGLNWRPSNIECLDCSATEAIARPWVIRGPSLYHLWYCYRSVDGYRNDPLRSYRIGYATSPDGLIFKRHDSEVRILHDDPNWDGEMQAYPALYAERGRYYLLYNGNGFGRGGFGYATSELELE